MPDGFGNDTALQELDGPVPLAENDSFVQPRAALYRASTDTILIASEGLDTLTEVDARSLDPSLHPLRTYAQDSKVGCATCHVPATGFTDHSIVALPRPQRRGFDAEANQAFKTPSLLYLGGTAPYFHDGAAATIDDVILKNNDAMGHTSHLSTADRSALIAYLKTL